MAVAALYIAFCVSALVVQADCIRSVTTGAALISAGRQLQQASERCPAGCTSTGCVLDSTSGGYRCIACQGTLVINADDGTCGCPAGRYATDGDCTDCSKGSYCLGGTYAGPNVPGQTACPSGLTTVGRRSASIKACVNTPGSFYTMDTLGNPSSTACPADTYGPGLRKQRACAPCPPGYTTKGLTGQTSATACVVPEGYYLEGPGQVAPCPKGEWKSGFDPLPSCTKCANGVSTPTEASTSEAACTVLLPTFYPATIANNIITATKKCPQKFYCPGGSPTAALNLADLTALAGTTVVQCADGTWTENIGASSADQCMTPPGHKTAGGATTLCADGEYRADWALPSAAASCSVCGQNILSQATEEITAYDAATEAPSPVYVSVTDDACYIKPGQGMSFSAASNAYRAVNCDNNNYGVGNTTSGLAAYPCHDCPAGMMTSTALAPSSNYYASDSGKQGFTNPLACVTQAGYGYNGRIATKCPAGSFNAAGNYGTCTKCAAGLSTVDNAVNQTAFTDCKLAVGYGFHDNAIVPCPIGTFNDRLQDNTTAPCQACTAGLTTSQAGGRSSEDCNVCARGYGGAGCASKCGGAAGATYGPAGRSILSPNCIACPSMVTGFSFDYLAQNQNFTPAAVAREGAESPADCLAEFAQIADMAWYMGGSVALVNVTDAAGVNTWAGCVDNCQQDATCQYITYEYDGNYCYKKVASASPPAGDVVAFKAVTAGDTTAAQLRPKKKNAKGLSSGSYTFWKESAAGIGAASSTGPTTSTQACLNACDEDFGCAAVAMTGITSATAAPASCSLVRGDTTIATFKRSVTKAVVSRLGLAAVL